MIYTRSQQKDQDDSSALTSTQNTGMNFLDNRPSTAKLKQQQTAMAKSEVHSQQNAFIQRMMNNQGIMQKKQRDDNSQEIYESDQEQLPEIARNVDLTSDDPLNNTSTDVNQLNDDKSSIQHEEQAIFPRSANENRVVQQVARRKKRNTAKKSPHVRVKKRKRKYYMGSRGSAKNRRNALRKRFNHIIDINKYVLAIGSLPKTHPVVHSNIQQLTGAAAKSEVVFNKMTPTSDPINLLNWPNDNASLAIIKDKNSPNQNLTRMHQIRGRFGGQSITDNMFLGTALSNNFHADSHYAQVESWIEQAMPLSKASVVKYIVQPQFGSIPQYIATRIQNSGQPQQWQIDMTNWCNQATPKTFNCSIEHYYVDLAANLRQHSKNITLSAET